MKVELYDVILNHGGNSNHSTPLRSVSMKEIILMRAIHGDDSVPDATIKVTGSKEVDEKFELYDLARRYANTQHPLSGKRVVERTFSTALVGFEKWLDDTVEFERLEREERQAHAQREMAKIESAAHVAAAAAVAARAAA